MVTRDYRSGIKPLSARTPIWFLRSRASTNKMGTPSHAHPLENGVGGLAQPLDEHSLYQSGFDAMECPTAPVQPQTKSNIKIRKNSPAVRVRQRLHPPDNPIGKNFTICSAHD